MSVGVLVLILQIPGCASLKEKRGRLKPLLAKLHKEFNLSAAEIDDHDIWGRTVIACALVSNSSQHTQSALQKVANWVELEWRDMQLEDVQIELI
ncbi:MAG: DUF503 family protein [candidate division Zixibacteria bacterium]|nr:DUF503 family protein [Gammaproteobacteria bacterium]NIX58143.1 DUF503 family protein [candidate division Zixibacteria bacterium]